MTQGGAHPSPSGALAAPEGFRVAYDGAIFEI